MAKQSFNWNNIPWTPIVLLGVVIVGKKTLIDPLLETFNLKDSKDDKKVDASSRSEWWSASYFKTHNGSALMKQADIHKAAETIYDAKGYVYDDESAAIGVIRNIQYKSQISQLAETFNTMYKKDLYAYLLSFLSQDQMVQLIDIVKNKPTGF